MQKYSLKRQLDIIAPLRIRLRYLFRKNKLYSFVRYLRDCIINHSGNKIMAIKDIIVITLIRVRILTLRIQLKV